MTRGRKQRAAAVGVAEHGSSAVLVTVAPGGELIDRRRIELIDRGLPTHPHHHEGSWAVGRYLNIPGARALSLADAVALVERVRASAARGARESLDRVINISGVPGLLPTGSIALAVSKAGLIHLTRCLALALAPSITVNCIAPGLMEGTRMFDRVPPARVAAVKEQAALKRTTKPEDVARQVLVFCQSDSVTGQTHVIDSGMVFH